MVATVRRVGPDDWADWRLLRQRSLTEDPDAFASSVTMWTGANDIEKRWRARLTDGPCFIAYDGDTPVGMVGGRADGHSVELISMWVASEMRSRGLGDALIDQIVRWAGDRPMHLRVMDGNTRAIRVYEAAGFVLDPACADPEGCRRMIRPVR